jgi:hypothetical protein
MADPDRGVFRHGQLAGHDGDVDIMPGMRIIHFFVLRHGQINRATGIRPRAATTSATL